jgi:predicted DNA-binding transcriptional regulator AlpA
VKTGLQVLGVERPAIPVPTHRGRLLTAAQVAELLFSSTVSAAWVRRNVPHKLVLGHSTVRWYEYDVQAWISKQRLDAPTCEPA